MANLRVSSVQIDGITFEHPATIEREDMESLLAELSPEWSQRAAALSDAMSELDSQSALGLVRSQSEQANPRFIVFVQKGRLHLVRLGDDLRSERTVASIAIGTGAAVPMTPAPSSVSSGDQRPMRTTNSSSGQKAAVEIAATPVQSDEKPARSPAQASSTATATATAENAPPSPPTTEPLTNKAEPNSQPAQGLRLSPRN